jgi:hypothetical protein
MLERGASEVEVQALLRTVKELERIVCSVDFNLDEFGVGICAVPPKGKFDELPEAVRNAMVTLRSKLAVLRNEKKELREALTQVKVDHINKKIRLPLETHGVVENTLYATRTD